MAEDYIFLGLAFYPNNVYLNIYVKTTFQEIKENNFKQFSLFLFVSHVLPFGLGNLFVCCQSCI